MLCYVSLFIISLATLNCLLGLKFIKKPREQLLHSTALQGSEWEKVHKVDTAVLFRVLIESILIEQKPEQGKNGCNSLCGQYLHFQLRKLNP